VKLWTFQSPNFSLTEGSVIHQKSAYYQESEEVQTAYPKLWKLIAPPHNDRIHSRGQILWYETVEQKPSNRPGDVLLWEVDVPELEIIAFVDSVVWDHIVQKGSGVGPSRYLCISRIGSTRRPFPPCCARVHAAIRIGSSFWAGFTNMEQALEPTMGKPSSGTRRQPSKATELPSST